VGTGFGTKMIDNVKDHSQKWVPVLGPKWSIT